MDATCADAMRRASKARVLIVDDDAALRRMLTMVLEDAEWDVLEAKDGLEALDILRSSPSPLVVLLDWRMPQMSGEEVLEAIKADPKLATRHSYVLVTANAIAPSHHLTDLLRELSVPVVAKPFNIHELLTLVENQARTISTKMAVS